ncbi:MAG: TIM barrel protein, partial [Nitrospiraceae bacterium]|nr:TIM barrel protein [Nitrospiraceae bacterium]
MAKISIMTMVFGGMLENGELSDVEMLRALETMGYDGVELTAGRIQQLPDGLAVYKAYLADSRLDAPCLDVGCNLVGEDAASRQAGIDALRAGIELAAELGCRVALGAGSRLSGSITPEGGRRMTADGLNACMEEAQAAGVTLAIEDFGVAPRLQCVAADCAAILDAVPGLS